MNEKITTQRLADLLVEKAGIGQNNADSFLKTMFGLIEDALSDDKYVKIKGLGTFKIIEVDSRESVDVNTSERIVIDGHPKITFVPEPTLRDLINKPFAQFETVILNDGVTFEDVKSDDDDNDQDEADDHAEDEVTQDNNEDEDNGDEDSVVSEPEDVVTKSPQDEMNVEDSSLANASDISVEENVVAEKPIETVEAINPTQEQQEILEVSAAEGDLHEASQSIKEEIEEEPEEETEEEEVESSVPNTSYSLHFAITLTLLLMVLIGGSIIYFCYPELIFKNQNKPIAGDSILNKKKVLKRVEVKSTLSLEDSIALLHNMLADAERREHLKQSTDSTEEQAALQSKPVKAEKPVATKLVVAKHESKEKRKEKKTDSDKKEKKTTDNKKVKTINGHKISGTLQTVTLKPGQTLVSLSKQYYGKKEYWTVIAEYNKSTIKNADHVPFGTKIKLPKIDN